MWLILVLGVAVLVVAAVISVYLLAPPPPIPLSVTDGSMVGTIRGNLTSISSGNPFIRYFNATTYANQSQGASSSFSLGLVVTGWHILDSGSNPWAGTWLMSITMTAIGRFAANTDPRGLTLACNGTSANVHVDSENSYLTGANVTFSPQANVYFVDSGSASVAATPTGPNPTGFYAFSFSDRWRIDEYLSYNGTYGFRATVTGSFTPSVSVGILLRIIDVPA